MLRLMARVGMVAALVGITNTAVAKTLVDCSEASPSSFSPALTFDGASNFIEKNIYDQLVEFKIGTTEIVPGLAEKWEVSKDGLTYTFHLRKNVAFQETANFKPSRSFNSDDVLFSFNRQRLADHPYHKISGGNYVYWDSMGFPKLVKDVVKVDDFTVKIILTAKEAPFLADLAMDFAAIYSAEYADQLLKKGTPERIDIEPVSTGPFAFVKYEKDQTVRLKAHPKHFRGKPKLDTLIYSITPDASVRIQKLKAGECQFTLELPPAEIPNLKKDPNLKVMEKAGLVISYLSINVTKPPFDKLLVRKAVYHALNRKSYIEGIYLNNAELAKNPYPPTIWGYNNKVKDYEYSISKAKDLLKQAGFPNGFETELWVLPVSRFYNPDGKKMGEMMQSDLAKVGIKVKITTTDWAGYLKKGTDGTLGLAQFGWQGDNGDPDNFLYMLHSCEAAKVGGASTTKWCYKPFDEVVTKARQTTNHAERVKLYEQAQEIIHEQIPLVPIAYNKLFRAMSKKVVNFKIHALGHDFFGDVDLTE